MPRSSTVPRRAVLYAAAILSAAFAALCWSLRKAAPPAVPAAKPENGAYSASAGAEGESDRRILPVLMYHSVCADPLSPSEYVLSPDALRQDLAFLKERGYQTVFLSDVLAFAGGGGDLPEKPVAITFDDGYLNNLTEALPLLREYGAVAEISVVGAFADAAETESYRSPRYSYLRWSEVRELLASGCFELGSHTYDMHALSPREGLSRMPGESQAAYETALRADDGRLRAALLREKIGDTVICAYPYGAGGKDARGVLSDLGYTVFLSCGEHVNRIQKNAPLPELGRFHRAARYTTAEFMARALGEP